MHFSSKCHSKYLKNIIKKYYLDCVEQYCKEDKNIPENDGWNDENCNVEYNFVCEIFPEGGSSINDPHIYPTTG